MLGNKWLERVDHLGVWILLFLVLLFILTGYGMTKHIMDPVLAKYIHSQLLPLPLFFFLWVHILKPVYKQFKNWRIFKSERTLTAYVYLLTFAVTGLFAWLYFR